MNFLKLLWYTTVGTVSTRLVTWWVQAFGKSRPNDAAELEAYVATYEKATRLAWERYTVFHTRREQFDEWRFGRWVVQFFKPRLWRWGWRYLPQVGYTQVNPTNPISPCIRPVPKGWVLALPILSIQKF